MRFRNQTVRFRKQTVRFLELDRTDSEIRPCRFQNQTVRVPESDRGFPNHTGHYMTRVILNGISDADPQHIQPVATLAEERVLGGCAR